MGQEPSRVIAIGAVARGTSFVRARIGSPCEDGASKDQSVYLGSLWQESALLRSNTRRMLVSSSSPSAPTQKLATIHVFSLTRFFQKAVFGVLRLSSRAPRGRGALPSSGCISNPPPTGEGLS